MTQSNFFPNGPDAQTASEIGDTRRGLNAILSNYFPNGLPAEESTRAADSSNFFPNG